MKLQLIITLLWLMAVPTQAQHKQGGVLPNMRRDIKVATVLDTAQVVVYYAFNADDIHNERTYTDRQWLLVGREWSKYASHFAHLTDSAYVHMLKRYAGSGSRERYCIGYGSNCNWSEYQYDELYMHGKELTEYAFMPMYLQQSNCRVTESYPSQLWTLTQEQKDILGYHCQKAVCRWRGRDYEAWFTMEIPVRKGPWKFGGLPGLIINLYDTSGEYKWECVGVSRERRPITQVNLRDFRPYDRKDLLKLQKKINTNYWKTVDPRNTQVPDTPYSPLEKE